jgi:curved DNA-binding protein CbpA
MSFLREPGDLAQTPLAAVLLEALNQHATGVLEVAHGGGTSRLWFRDGRPVGAQVYQGFNPLGQRLLQAGLIDIDALSASLALMAQTKRPQGELLVEMGVVSQGDVERMLEEQQAGYFACIAALESAPFAFDEVVTVPEWTHGSRLSPMRAIVDALERPQAAALVVSALQPVTAGGVRLLPGYRDLAPEFRWTDAERALVARLECPTSLEGFFGASAVAPERARAVLSALLLLGLAGSATAGTTPVPGRVASTPAPRAAPPEAPAAAPAPAARRSDPAEARARRQRLLQQAMRNMGVGPFAAGAADAAEARATAGEGSGAAPAGGARRAAESATAAERQLRDALLALVPRAQQRDYFARLGIPDTAGREDVKKAFLVLAKQFHPDRFTSRGLADLQDVVKDFFASINEAYEVLSDDRKRPEYLAARRSRGAVHAEAARVDFQKGEACLRTRDYGRARGFLESAVRADPRSEYQAALAFACLADPARKDRDRARRLLEEATKDPTCDRALHVSGILARDEGDDAAAERLFRAAVKANPRNVEAVRELRLAEGRRADKRR